MSYHFTTTLEGVPFDQAIEKVTAALKEKGFGVLTTIDVKKTMKEKIDVDFRPYVILGACNPRFAHQALSREDKIGTMMPCNVILQDKDGVVEVSAVNPIASMAAVQNAELGAVAGEVSDLLKQVIEGLR
ncbi:MAG: DUF302 domain-containing protein [Magnetospirillum sp. WYHS-4]